MAHIPTSAARRALAAALLCGASLWLAACGDSGPGPGEMISSKSISAPTGVTASSANYLITYRIRGVAGDFRDEKAVVLIPGGTAPSGGYPVIAWGHGTTGDADICAPSASADLAQYGAYLNQYLAQGYAVVAPDYEGLGTPGGHPYLHVPSEGQAMVRAVQAAKAGFASLSSRWAAVGHSQGGQAALAAAEYAGLATGMSFVGTVAFAPASNVETIGDQLRAAADNPSAPIPDRIAAGTGAVGFGALILGGVQAVSPSFQFSSALGTAGAGLEDSVNTKCLNDVFADAQAAVTAAITSSNSLESVLKASWKTDPAVSAYLPLMEPGTKQLSAPTLLIQGTADTTVPATATQALLARMQGLGSTVTYSEKAGSTHSSIIVDGIVDALGFLATRFAATP
ncbi:MAG: alpha/beta fold hydrolase [Burkholderiaceae bacterium]|nr:alpha/beta fold hydrolase [Burkholderiaceae bacterium]